MERLLRRYIWVVDLIGIGIGAALAGHATALLIAGALQPQAAPTPHPPGLRAEQSMEGSALHDDRPKHPCAPANGFSDCVRRIGPFRYEVRRAFGDQLWGLVPPGPLCVPEPRGIRLFMRGDSPFAALGLRSGDLAMQLNGLSLATPDGTLRVYTALRTVDHLSLLIERRRKQIRIDYVIR